MGKRHVVVEKVQYGESSPQNVLQEVMTIILPRMKKSFYSETSPENSPPVAGLLGKRGGTM